MDNGTEQQVKTEGGARRKAIVAVPLILVNGVAIWGQSGWAFDHVTFTDWPSGARWVLAVAFALTVESVGVYLAYEAHAALMADQAAFKLRLGSYAIGALAGTLNYAHFSTDWQPHPTAVAFAIMSAISPWLWGIRSRAMQRELLMERGLIDRRAVRFSSAQWALYPVRSWRAWRRAIWVGEQDPAAARLLADATVPPQKPRDVSGWYGPMTNQPAPMEEAVSAAWRSVSAATQPAASITAAPVSPAPRRRPISAPVSPAPAAGGKRGPGRPSTTAQDLAALLARRPELVADTAGVAAALGIGESTARGHLRAYREAQQQQPTNGHRPEVDETDQ